MALPFALNASSKRIPHFAADMLATDPAKDHKQKTVWIKIISV